MLMSVGCTNKSDINIANLKKNSVKYTTIQNSGQKMPSEIETKNWILSQENEYLILYYKADTAEIKIFDKRTSGWWYSNPKEQNGVSNAGLSQVTVSAISKDGTIKEYSSYIDCIRKKQFVIESGDSLKVIYNFGDLKPDLAGIPQNLTNERYEELKKRAQEVGANDSLFKRRYMQNDKGIWQRKASITVDQAKKLREVYDAIGYTEEEYYADVKAAGGGTEKETNSFTIPLEYTLQDDSVLVKISGKEFKHPTSEIITSIRVLGYFGSLDKDEQGYFLIPNGSGALVNASKQASKTESVSIPIYGTDYTIPVERKSDNDTANMLPVFGISRANDGVFAIIEDNDAISSIDVTKAAENGKMNTVSASFSINAVQNIGLSDTSLSKFYVTSDVKYDGDTIIRYIFLEKENHEYSGMASIYRAYLDLNQNRKRNSKNEDIPLYIETIGSVYGKTSTLGIVHDKNVAMTTFENDIEILKDISKSDINNVNLILSGWFNGGEQQQLADKVEIMSVLGGNRGFEKLLDYAQNCNFKIYPKLLLNSFGDKVSNSVKNKNASKTLGNKKSLIYRYDKITSNYLDDGSQRYILTPAKQKSISDKLLNKLESRNIDSVLIDDLAYTFYSDYNNKSEFLRQHSLLQSEQILGEYSNKTKELMLAKPNVNSAQFSDSYTDIPNSSGSYRIFDSSVPFVQMIYHGYADYSATSINFTSDFDTNFLKCAEYGSCLKFRFIYNEDADISSVEETDYYAARYSRWKEKMFNSYKELNEILSPVKNAVMIDHLRLSEGIYKTDYDNGYSVYVNYNDMDYNFNGVSVKAGKAICMRGE